MIINGGKPQIRECAYVEGYCTRNLVTCQDLGGALLDRMELPRPAEGGACLEVVAETVVNTLNTAGGDA